MFSEKGYRGTSLASIAAAVDLTEPGLLHYFPSKVKLLQGVLEYRERADEQKYSHLVDSDSLEFNVLAGALEHLVADNQDKPALIRLFTVLVAESIRTDHPSHDFFLDRYRLVRRIYGEVFTRLQAEGQIRSDVDPEQLGVLVMSVMDGLQIQWLLDPESVDMAESFKVFSEMLSDYLND